MLTSFVRRRAGVVLSTLLLSSCSWVAGGNSPQPLQRSSIQSPEAPSLSPPAQAPAAAAAAPTPDELETVAATCTASKVGQVIGFEAFYTATLTGPASSRLYISRAPGAAPGKSYGLPGDTVEAIATTLDESCEPWLWLKWPESDFRGWLPAASVEIKR